MPIIDSSFRVPVTAGTRVATGRVNRTADFLADMKEAVNRAHNKFVAEFGREPDVDILQFLGFSTTFEIVFEILESDY